MSEAPPFGLVLPSRSVLTNAIKISPTQHAFIFHATPTFSHLAVFLVPGTVLPEGTLAGVYIQLPNSAPEFKLLGAIGTEKQSAIFRVSGRSYGNSIDASNGSGPSGAPEDEMTDVDETTQTISNGTAGGDVTVGISIEPAANLTTQLETLMASQSTSSTALVTSRGQQNQSSQLSTKVLAQRIIENAFNFLASFAGTTGVGGQEVVPLKSFQDWWTKFERRIANDPGFLEREECG